MVAVLRLILFASFGLLVLTIGRLGAAMGRATPRGVPGARQSRGVGQRLGRLVGAGLGIGLLLLIVRLTAPPVPSAPVSPDAPPPQPTERMEGRVLSATPIGRSPASGQSPDARSALEGIGAGGTVLQVEITRGSQRDRVVQITLPSGSLSTASTSAASYRPGDWVVVSYLPQMEAVRGGAAPGSGGVADVAPGSEVIGAGEGAFRVVDHVRWPWLVLGMGVFAVSIAVVAGKMGLRALTGLTLAIFILWWFVIPRLLAGQPPVPVALCGCAMIAIPSLLLTHGLNREGLVPLAGIAGSLALVGIMSTAAVRLARLSGLAASEEISLVYVGTQGAVDPQGLLLAGMLIGVVGGLVDVTVGQSAAVFEFRDADPSASRQELFRRGMNVGRAHVAATVHTLVLAYAGAALPMLLLFAMYSSALGDIWNRELIVAEILRSLAGSIGLAAAMPLTTWIACLVCPPSPVAVADSRPRRRPALASTHHHH
ncbi:MAG TPA: YibE/F family protein [Chloroflexota bacterium]|jgi:uncharacterized membrane protein|nr:YibE/F family protein [Chloroflexota bacterium]